MQYLTTKVVWISRSEKQEVLMNKLYGYRPPVWAVCVIRIMQQYGTKIKYIRMAALVDKEKIVNICCMHSLNFWGI